jgi:hypothetical protein
LIQVEAHHSCLFVNLDKPRRGSASSRSTRSSSPPAERQRKSFENRENESPGARPLTTQMATLGLSSPLTGRQTTSAFEADDTGPPVIKLQSPKLIETLEDYDPVRFQRPVLKPAKVITKIIICFYFLFDITRLLLNTRIQFPSFIIFLHVILVDIFHIVSHHVFFST